MIRAGKAIWRTNNHDLNVEVIKHLGTHDGVSYYLVEAEDGSGKTGVPEHDLVQKSIEDLLEEFAEDGFKNAVKLVSELGNSAKIIEERFRAKFNK